MELKEFIKQITKFNDEGRAATLKHRELYPKSDDKDNKSKGGRRYHVPGTDDKCAYCNKIIKAHDDMMALQKETFGIVGIPMESLMPAIHITRGVVKMMKEGGEL